MGLSVLLPLSQVDGMSPDEVKRIIRDMGLQMTPLLRAFVGEAKPKGDPAFRVDGPEDHGLLGPVYVLSIAAPFETDDLPADCDAYLAFNGGRGGVIQHDPNAAGGA